MSFRSDRRSSGEGRSYGGGRSAGPGRPGGGDVQVAVVAPTGLVLIATTARIAMAVTTAVGDLIAMIVLIATVVRIVRGVQSVQVALTTRAVLIAVGASIAKPVQVVLTTKAALIAAAALIGIQILVEISASPEAIAKIAATASVETTGPPAVAASKQMGRPTATTVLVPIRVRIAHPDLVVAVAFSVMIVSPVKIDSIGAIVRGVSALEEIAQRDRVPPALNVFVVSARMVAVAPVVITGIAMSPERASINLPARVRR